MQSYEWAELKAKSGWTHIPIHAEREGSLVAAASLLKRNIPHTSRSIIYVPRGPVLDCTDSELVAAFSGFLRQIAVQERAILVKIDPPIPVEDANSEQNLRKSGFIQVGDGGFGGTQPKCVMQLDLCTGEEELLASFKPKWRYNIRLAERKGVRVDLHCSRDRLPVFYSLLEETCARDGFLVRGIRYFENMWDVLADAGYMQLVLTYHDDSPVAGALVYRFGDRAMYTYGASSNLHRNVMPNHLMQWTIIKWARDAGCKWYDFRGVSPRRQADPDDHLQGLNRFKEGFSPRFVEYIGEYDMIISPFWHWMWEFARPRMQRLMKARSRARQSASGDV